MKKILLFAGLLCTSSFLFAQVVFPDTVYYVLPKDNFTHMFVDSISNNTPNIISFYYSKTSDNLMNGVTGVAVGDDAVVYSYDTAIHFFNIIAGGTAPVALFLKADTNAVSGISYITFTTPPYGSLVFKIETVPTPSCYANFYMFEDTLAAPHTYIGINTCVGNQLTYDWNWGDGTPNTAGPYPSHTYSAAGIYNICVSISDTTGCTDTYCSNENINKTLSPWYTVTFGSPNKITDNTVQQTYIYPNPAYDELYIRGENSTVYLIDIFSLNGSKVFATSIKGNQAVNISTLADGIYFAKISDSNGDFQNVKLVKR